MKKILQSAVFVLCFNMMPSEVFSLSMHIIEENIQIPRIEISDPVEPLAPEADPSFSTSESSFGAQMGGDWKDLFMLKNGEKVERSIHGLTLTESDGYTIPLYDTREISIPYVDESGSTRNIQLHINMTRRDFSSEIGDAELPRSDWSRLFRLQNGQTVTRSMHGLMQTIGAETTGQGSLNAITMHYDYGGEIRDITLTVYLTQDQFVAALGDALLT